MTFSSLFKGRWPGVRIEAAGLPRLGPASRRLLRRLGILHTPTHRKNLPFRLATGDARIYHIHVRKTGGTSLNHVFLGISGEDPAAAYRALAARPSHCREWRGCRYVGWNVDAILEGDYFYAFSHTPIWRLNLPANTFTVTCLRDPVDRVLSHYWMLREYVEQSIAHPCVATEGRWLGNSFDGFLDRMPPEHLAAQLWMYSSSFDVAEALDRLGRVSHVMFTEHFAAGLQGLERRLGLSLPYDHRRAGCRGEVSPASITRLRDMLADEYRFLAGARAALHG